MSQGKLLPSHVRHKPKGTIHPWGNWSWELVRGGQLVLCWLSRARSEGLDEVTHVHEDRGEFSRCKLT